MAVELTTQEQFDAFAEEVSRELGTHCRTAPATVPAPGFLVRVVIDGDGRALTLWQPNGQRPTQLKVYAAMPDESPVSAPLIGVTASSARHVASEITRRLYPQHDEAVELAAQITARQEAEKAARRAVTEAVSGALPGARVEELHRRTRVLWQNTSRPPGQLGPVRVDSVCAVVGASGEWVQVEASGPPGAVVDMLSVFAQTLRG